MFKRIINAYGAGYRAGLADANYTCNPFSGLLAVIWAMGWDDGSRKGLIHFLKRKGF
jgi:hypothetical protein